MKIKDLNTEHPKSTWYIEKRWAAIVEVLKAAKDVLDSVPTSQVTSLPFPFTKAHQNLSDCINQLEDIV
jgi:hypothetical protein